jgi:hypothetical protein
MPGVVVYSDVAACHDGVSEEDQRLQRLCDGLWRWRLAVDGVVAWAHCTDRLRWEGARGWGCDASAGAGAGTRGGEQ